MKSTYHASDGEPATGDEDQKNATGVAGKYVPLMLGFDSPMSTMDTSSMRDGRRQSLWPARVSVGQYATACVQVYVPVGTAFCHMSPVTLSVIVWSPLSVYASGFGAPAATSAGPFGIGHSAQVGSTQAAGAPRSQSSPVEHVEVLNALQPFPATLHV